MNEIINIYSTEIRDFGINYDFIIDGRIYIVKEYFNNEFRLYPLVVE